MALLESGSPGPTKLPVMLNRHTRPMLRRRLEQRRQADALRAARQAGDDEGCQRGVRVERDRASKILLLNQGEQRADLPDVTDKPYAKVVVPGYDGVHEVLFRASRKAITVQGRGIGAPYEDKLFVVYFEWEPVGYDVHRYDGRGWRRR